jgi:hypothetical protein
VTPDCAASRVYLVSERPTDAFKPFPHQDYVNRLFNKAKSCDNVSVFREYLCELPTFGDRSYEPVIDGFNFFSHLELLAEHALVNGLARYSARADLPGLRNCANAASGPTSQFVRPDV